MLKEPPNVERLHSANKGRLFMLSFWIDTRVNYEKSSLYLNAIDNRTSAGHN